MKVETIEQYKILEYVKEHFNIENVTLEFISRNEIKLTDKNDKSIDFIYINDKVEYVAGGVGYEATR